MSNNDRSNLLGILDAVSKIQIFTTNLTDAEDLFSDQLRFDAVVMNFIVIGEMIERLSKPLLENNPHIEWLKIKGLRNIIAHDYFGIDAEEIWQIVKDDIPSFKGEIKKLLA